ncbi:MAG: thioredoxin [Pirellulales bacterium]|nr:thioredoxin [Pirellulales bacterium]
MNGLLEFSDINFESEVLQSSRPVVVDFSAAWCGPCKMLAPVVEELANENAGVAKIGKIDVDANPGTAAKYGVSSIPTIMVFKNGRVVDTLVGLQPKANIQEAMARAAL